MRLDEIYILKNILAEPATDNLGVGEEGTLREIPEVAVFTSSIDAETAKAIYEAGHPGDKVNCLAVHEMLE